MNPLSKISAQKTPDKLAFSDKHNASHFVSTKLLINQSRNFGFNDQLNTFVIKLFKFCFFLITALLFLNTKSIKAQENQPKVVDYKDIYGYISDASGNKLEGVNIYQINDKDTLAVSITDMDGFYHLRFSNEIEALKFDRIGFESYYFNIRMEATDEDNRSDIVLIKKTYSLPEVTVTEEEAAMAYQNKDIWVYDFILDTSGITLLMGSFSQKIFLKINFDQDTILKTEVPYKFNNLLQDALGNYYVSKKDSIYQLVTVQDSLQLMFGIKKADYYTKIWPIIYKNDNIVILKKYLNYNNEIIYTKYDRKRKQYSLLKKVTNVEQLNRVH